MNLNCHLIVDRHGKVRVTKNQPSLDPDEIAIGVTLDIPNRLFQRPILSAEIAVTEDMLASPTYEAIVNMNAETVADALRLNVDDVLDGLQLAIDRKDNE